MSKRETYRGLTFTQALFLLFLGLKLAGSIQWSWWAVFAPIVAGIIFALAEALTAS